MNAAQPIRNHDETPAERLGSLARECLAANDGNTTKAISCLVDKVLKQRELLRELVAPIVLNAVKTVVRHASRQERQTFVKTVSQRGQVIAMAGAIRKSWLDFPLRNGVLLRDAKRSLVAEQANFYERQGSDMLHKGRFLSAIAQSVPEDKTVGEVITDERANELWESSNV